MKQIFISAILVFSFCTTAFSQTNPQFGFNAESDYSEFTNTGNDYSDYLLSRVLVAFVGDLSNKDKLQLCYRMYEIEHTSKIVYATLDDKPLPLQTSDDSARLDLLPVDFGAALEDNDEDEIEDGVEFSLWFAAPVTKIDPAIFAAPVTRVALPSVDRLEYRASAASCVRNLVEIKGKDVVDKHLLVNRRGELIVAAVAGRTRYDIPSQVTKIGDGAFRGCTLQEVYIPGSVKQIGEKAFDMCEELQSVYLFTPVPIQIAPSAFSNEKSLKYKVYVPKESLKLYKKQCPSLKKRLKPMK